MDNHAHIMTINRMRNMVVGTQRRNVINHAPTPFGTCRQEVLMLGWWHYECCGVLSLAEEVERFFYILVGGCLVDENGPDIT